MKVLVSKIPSSSLVLGTHYMAVHSLESDNLLGLHFPHLRKMDALFPATPSLQICQNQKTSYPRKDFVKCFMFTLFMFCITTIVIIF